MKICLINNSYKPFNRGGADRIVEITENLLKKGGHEVFVISTKPDNKNKALDKNNYYLKSNFLNLHKIPVFLRLFWHIWDMLDFVTGYKIKEILKKEEPDVVWTHNTKGLTFLLPKIIKNLKIKHVHTLHDMQLIHPSGLMYIEKENTIDSIHAKIYQTINRFLFNSPDIIISPSNWLLNAHKEKKIFFKIK
jgi:hypothetical protein